MKGALILLVLMTSIFSCKENITKPQLEAINTDTSMETNTFPESVPTCVGKENIFKSIPHLDTYGEYTYDVVGCTKHGLVAVYNHPSNEFYEFKFTISEEVNENKTMLKYIKTGHKSALQYKADGNDVSDLHLFDNEFVTLKKEPDYDDVTYNATYKDKYIIIITLRGKNLSGKAAIDSFLKKYLEAINKDLLI
tara:strand:- start:97 stop:678 length:582 start_codon:yes stop_codon:yes gene_type:complete